MSILEPTKITTPWASAGSKNPIPANSNNTTGAAGFDKGFPDITMTPEEAGGLPPAGQDFNGILYEVTSIIRYFQAGGKNTFSSDMASAIGGYGKGAVISGDNGETLYISRKNNNFDNPNVPSGSGWSSFSIGDFYSYISTYSGGANYIYLYGGVSPSDGGEGTFYIDSLDLTSPAITGMVIIDALGRRWKRVFNGDAMAKWFLIKGDKVTDDTAKFVEAWNSYCKPNKKNLDIGGMKISLPTLSESIDLGGEDDPCIIGSGVPSKLPVIHLNYLNGADESQSVWMQEANFVGSAIYCPSNIAIFTGKALNIKGVLLVGDYNNPNNDAFLQSTPTAYPGWSRALENASVTVHYFGGYGIKLVGGLEVCNPKNIKIAFTKKNCLYVGKTTGINCPIEYIKADETCYFMYSKINNVLLDGFRKDVDFSGCLLNGPGQLDVVKHFNPSYVLPDIGSAWAAISVVVEPVGGLHTSSFSLKVDGCYAEACQNLLTVSGEFLNNISMTGTTMYPVDNTWVKAQLITYNQIAKIKTDGNQAPDGKFYYWLDAPTRAALVALDIGEESLDAAVNVGASVDPNKRIIPNKNSFIALGNGLGGDARFDLDDLFVINTPIDTSAKSIMLLVTSNFGTTTNPSMGAYVVIASRHASNTWIGVVIPSGSDTGFVSPPVISTDGQLSFNLAVGYYASVSRVDGTSLLPN